MMILLFLLSTVAMAIQHWCGLRIIETIYSFKVPEKSRFLYVALPLALLCNGCFFGVQVLQEFQPFIEWLELLLLIPNPLWALAVYYAGYRLLPISQYGLLCISRQIYCNFLLFSPIRIIIMRKYLIQVQGQQEYYFPIIISTILITAICLALYQAGNRVVKHCEFRIHIPADMPFVRSRASLFSVFIVFAAYALSVYMELFHETLLGDVLMVFCLLLTLVCDIMWTNKESLRYEINTYNIKIGGLMRTIEKYMDFKNQFHSILQPYENYLQENDLDGVVQYHQSIMGNTLLSVQSIDIAKRLSQNPPLVALLMKKINYANRLDVAFTIKIVCAIEEMFMEHFDLGRLLNNLLNNAIEAAAVSQARQVSLLIKEKGKNCNQIIITNSTVEDIDIEEILLAVSSAKSSHTGVGLVQVRKIIEKHSNAALNYSYANHIFNTHIQLWRKEVK